MVPSLVGRPLRDKQDLHVANNVGTHANFRFLLTDRFCQELIGAAVQAAKKAEKTHGMKQRKIDHENCTIYFAGLHNGLEDGANK